MALTKVTGQVINDTTGLVVGVTTVGGGLSATDGFFSGIVTFSQGVSIGGTLTYEDVTNIDSVGLITARAGVVVGSGITLSKDGDGFFTGVVTATSYVGDGSGLTGVASTDNIRTNTNATFLQNVNVGSGITLSPSGDVFATGITTISRTGGNGLLIVERAGGAGLHAQAQSALGVFGTTSNHDLRLISNGNERMLLSTNGNVTVTTGNIVIGTSGKGIDFSATGDGSGASNVSELLDDYEEGTWTPDLQFGGSNTGITYDYRYGHYTKIGRQITVIFRIKLSNKGSASGAAKFEGLPFATKSITNTQMSIGSVWCNSMNIQGTHYYMVCRTDGNAATFVEPKNVGYSGEDAVGDSDFTNNADMTITITYLTE